MNTLIEKLNAAGESSLGVAWPILWQSSLLIALLIAVDIGLRKKIRASIRYALWLVVLVKLVLPPSLALPTSFAWWLRHAEPAPAKPVTVVTVAQNPAAWKMPTVATAPVVLPPSPPAHTPLSSAASGLVLWSAVSLGLLFWLALRWRQVAREIHAAAPAPAWLNELLDEARVAARVRRVVPLRIVNRAMSPAVCGLFRPVILLPQSLVEQLSPAQLNAVLLHELMHLRRGDVWVNCAQALLQIFYWWHPLLWFANARIRRVREESVDDAVVLALKQEADQYAPTLIEVAKLAFHRPLATLGLVGILESRRALRQRIERLLNFATPRRAGLSVVSVLGIAAFTAMAVPMGEAPAKSQTDPAPLQSDARANPFAVAPPVLDITVVADGTYRLGTNVLGLADLRAALLLARLAAKQSGPDLAVRAQADAKVPFAHLVRLLDLCRELDIASISVTTAPSAPVNPNGRWIRSVQNGAADFAEPFRQAFGANGDKELQRATDILNSLQPEAQRVVQSSTTSEAGPGTFPGTLSPGTAAAPQAPANNPPASTLVRTSAGRQAIMRKLDQIRLPEVSYDRAPLRDVLLGLQDEIRKLDTERPRLNILLNPNPPASSPAQIDPATGLPVASQPPMEITDIDSIPITLKLRDVRLAEVFEAIVKAAGKPIKYSIQDYAVVFSLRNPDMPDLVIRKFYMDTVAFKRATGQADWIQATNLYQTFLRFFATNGVDLSPERGRSIFYRDTDGGLLVRATPEEINRIETLLASFEPRLLANAPSSPAARTFASPWESKDANTLVQNGRLFFEVGKLDEAEAQFRKALAAEPENKAAEYYLKLVQEKRGGQSTNPWARPSANGSATNLLIRTFKVDPNVFYLGLEAVGALPVDSISPRAIGNRGGMAFVTRTNQTSDLAGAVKKFFKAVGVDLEPPKTVFFNDRGGSLLVRATAADLDIIEAAIQTLNAVPLQVNIKVRWVEMEPGDSHTVGFDWYLGNTLVSNSPGAQGVPATAPTGVFPGNPGNPGSAAPTVALQNNSPNASNLPTITGILTDPQFRVVMRALEQRKNVNLLSEGQVTTLSGRQAQLQVVELRMIPTNINPQALTLPGVSSSKPDDLYQTMSLPCGPVLDVLPTVNQDGFTINLDLTASLNEFLGYEDRGKANLVTVYVDRKKKSIPAPIPKLRSRQLSTQVVVWDGQTVVLGGLTVDKTSPPNGQPPKKRNLLVFVTCTLIDPAGNRLHKDDNLPIARGAVLPQSH